MSFSSPQPLGVAGEEAQEKISCVAEGCALLYCYTTQPAQKCQIRPHEDASWKDSVFFHMQQFYEAMRRAHDCKDSAVGE